MAISRKNANVEDAALALREARSNRRPIDPISGTFGITDLATAYAVAGENNRLRLAEGAKIVGKKIGLTSRAVQKQLGVDQPDFGILYDDMELLNNGEVCMNRLMQPKIEAEVAFVVGRDLDGSVPGWAEFLLSIAYALPAIEVVDSAIADWKITLFDTVADNASSGLYVLGDQPVSIGAISLGDLGMTLLRNGEVTSVGSGSACLDHPLRAAYWLARTMAELGDGLKAGEVILSGALGPMVSIEVGDQIQVQIGTLGSVSCRIGA